MREDVVSGFCLGVLVGVLFLVLVNSMPWTSLSKSKAAVRDCEATLPRNEKCIITAVPAGKGGE